MKNLILLFLPLVFSSCTVSNSTKVESVTFEPSKDFLKQAESLSPQEEDAIGKGVSARILGSYKNLEDPKLAAYVNMVGQTVVAASARPATFSGYSFLVLDSAEVNALAAPGGYIFITEGFLRLLSDEDSLAAVLAHEVAHVSNKHGLKVIKPGHFADYLKVGEELASAVDCSGLSTQLLIAFKGAVNDVFETLIIRGYSRDQEYAADRGALETLEAAGYRAESIKTALEILEKKKAQGGWFSTHPKPEDRIVQVEGNLNLNPAAKLGYDDRKKRFMAAVGTLN